MRNINITVTFITFASFWDCIIVQGVTKLVGFNCTHEDIVVREFSLLEDPTCPDFKEIAVEEKATVQLVQRRAYKYVHAYGMQVTRTLHIMPCHGYGVTYQLTQRVLDVTKTQMETLYKNGQYTDEWVKLGDIPANGTHSWKGNLLGWTLE